ncbi:MAG: phosphate uptake regulator PhoU [Nitrososphaerota archaeon]|nr:phosphate uptake regulator PhoU [Candidatus Bathyarchaeota archaeon]MDW8193874.1 phosphate uptake regulator PhoU [Nitrososphaerota archaeon]
MESRKVQKVGYSTLTVSLPSEWAKRNNINPGDLIFIMQERDGTLKIMPGHVARREEAEEHIINADACNEKGMLERIIVGSYILGRDVIKIISSKRIEKSYVEEVRGIVQKLIGLGILEETQNSILLQCSIDPTKFKLDMLMRRLAIIASTMLSEVTQALVEGNKELANEAMRREEEADKIYYLSVRLLLLAQLKPEVAENVGVTEIIFIPATRLILQFLEMIADYCEDLAKKVLAFTTYRNKVSDETIKDIAHLGDLTQAIFQKAVDCLFSRDLKIANGILEMHKLLYEKVDRLMTELPEIPYLRAMISSLNKIADLGASIAEIAINRSLEKPDKDVEEIVKTIKHVRTVPLLAEKRHESILR